MHSNNTSSSPIRAALPIPPPDSIGSLSHNKHSESELQAARFLSELPAIRVWIPDTLRYGLQANSSHLVARIRDMGYERPIEVVYGQRKEGKLPRIDLFFDEFDPHGEEDQYNPEGNLRFISRSAFRERALKGEMPMVPLALSGGVDAPLPPTLLKAESIAWFNPAHWHFPSGMQFRGSSRVVPLESIQGASIRSPIPDPDDSQEFIRETFQKFPHLAQKREAVLAVDAARLKTQILPVYGMEIGRNESMRYLIAGLELARRGGPIILPVFEHFPLASIEKVIEQVKTDGVFKGPIRSLSFADQDIAEKVDSFPPDGITIVSLDRCPAPVFEFFLSQADLPPTLYGVSTSKIMHQLGKPYLPTTREMPTTLTKMGFSDHPGFKKLTTAMIALDRRRSNSLRVEPLKLHRARAIQEYIVEALDPNSEVTNLFNQIKDHVCSPENELVTQGLLAVKKEIALSA